ncbi:MAG: hypothetical protein M3406_10680 [Chloroflexota bacterium]|nr:hypothetical protein [Chloroflexota bacterium]
MGYRARRPQCRRQVVLLKTWVGFERTTRGSVRVAGIDPSRERAAALDHIGYVPQSSVLYDGLSIEGHLTMAVLLRRGFDRGRSTRADRPARHPPLG